MAKEAKSSGDNLQAAIDDINKMYGTGSIMKMSDKPSMNVSVIKTGSLELDIALGVGGYPKGRIVEIYGPEASGKSTLAQHAVAEMQKLGGVCAYVDVEHALDPVYAASIGVDIDELLISQPDTGEEALEIVDRLVASGGVSLIIVDSVAALTPRAEIEGEMGDSHVGLQARLMSQAMRKLNGKISSTNTCVIFINQLRYKIGVMYGSPEITAGGRALQYYASIRLDIRKVDTLKSGDEITGSRTKVKVIKNKVAPPFKVAEFDIMYGEGVSREGGILDLGVTYGFIKKAGAWFSYDNGTESVQVGQGRENAKVFLKANPKIADEIEKKIKAKALA